MTNLDQKLEENSFEEQPESFSSLDSDLISGSGLDAARAKMRSRMVWQFNIFVGLFILVCSFVYGLSKGVTDVKPAFASLSHFGGDEPISKEALAFLPRGVKAKPMGHNMKVNGKASEMISFQTNRKVKDLLSEATKIWEYIGLEVAGMATGKRGLIVATTPNQGLKISMNAWLVPGKFRRQVNEGYRVQGSLTISPTVEADGTMAERSGLVPGIPTLPGGRGGAVVSSDDPAGRSYSGTYTNPGTVEQSFEYYAGLMPQSGWVYDEGIVQPDYGYLRFVKGNKEISFLISPSQSSDTEESISIVTLGGRLVQ